MNRAELHLHTTMSEDISVIDPEEALNTALKLGCTAVAFVDRNSVQNFPKIAKFQQRYANGIKIIYGVQALVNHVPLTLLVQDDEGFAALNHVLTTGTLPLDQQTHLLVGVTADQVAHCPVQYDYLELTPSTPETEGKALYALGKELGVPVVAVGDCHYLTPEDRVGKLIADHAMERDNPAPHTHFRTTAEMLEVFAYLGEEAAREVVVTSPNALVERIRDGVRYAPKAAPLILPQAYKTLCGLCRQALTARYGTTPPASICQRLEEELALLDSEQTASLYLLFYKLTQSLQSDWLVGLRGTLGSTLVAFLLNFTSTNPLPAHYHCPHCHRVEFVEADSGFDLPHRVCPTCGTAMTGDGHNLSYEIALGLDGKQKPDSSLNVAIAAHEQALRFFSEFFGKEQVAFAGSYSSMMPKNATLSLADYEQRHNLHFTEEEKERIYHLLERVHRCNHRSPGGLLLLPEGRQWDEFTPLRNLSHSTITKTSHIHYLDLIHCLPRVDVLQYAPFDRLQELHRVTGVKPEEIGYNDPSVYQLFVQQDTGGLPEFSTQFMLSILSRFDTLCFSDLVRLNGMAHGTATWLDNAETLLEHHPLQELIGTRDDIFQTLQRYGVDRKIAFSVTNAARMGRFQREHPCNAPLLHKLERAGVPDWYITSLRRIRYLFPKAHAVQYVKTAVALAWFKRYYPAAFFEVTLSQPHHQKWLNCTNRELEDLLGNSNPLFPYSIPEKESALLILEARHKGYATEPKT